MSEYKALYRKWRPFDFDDVCGQNSITDILKYEVANDKISHAYLFCGSRGTGKTSCAKILAKAVNCTDPRNGNPCNKCEACRSIDAGVATDVIEMDAASNNGIDNVRNLKDEIAFTPALLKYRVYIIDEVHMMSGAAFNALLKTLEEPPSYVVFILATTEYNKLPTTIVSRCQRFDFRRMTSEVIIDRLFKISAAEGIDLTEDGARLIARASRGGMRDAVSLLELCAGSRERVDAELVASTIGSGDRAMVYKLVEALGKSDYDTVYTVIRDTVMKSGDISVFWQELIDSYRDLMVVKNSSNAKSYLDLTDVEYKNLVNIASLFTMPHLAYHASLLEEALSDMQRATNAKRSIAEIALTRMCDAKLVISPEALLVRVEELEKQLSMIKFGITPAVNKDVRATDHIAREGASVKAEEKPKTNEAPLNESAPEKKPAPAASAYSKWRQVIERISELKPSLSSPLNSAVAKVSGNKFTIEMKEFFAKRILAKETDFAILRGVIAECEGVSSADIEVEISIQKQAADNSLDGLFI